MKLEEVLTAIASQRRSEELRYVAKKFLYGVDGHSASEPNGEARKFLAHPHLQGRDFKYIDKGAEGLVIGDDKNVIKIYYWSKENKAGGVRVKDIPHGLAAEIRENGEGVCNSAPYLICERLDMKRKPTVEEVISFLFRARDQGVIYSDPKLKNFGFDAKGQLKALDHDHFVRFSEGLAESERKFAHVLNHSVLLEFSQTKCPLFFSDKQNTYIVLSTGFPPPRPEQELDRKQLQAILNNVGISSHDIEFVKGAPIIRIRGVDVTLGDPPGRQSLASYIRDSLEAPVGYASDSLRDKGQPPGLF